MEMDIWIESWDFFFFLSHRNNSFEQVIYVIGVSIYLIPKINILPDTVYSVYKINAMQKSHIENAWSTSYRFYLHLRKF